MLVVDGKPNSFFIYDGYWAVQTELQGISARKPLNPSSVADHS